MLPLLSVLLHSAAESSKGLVFVCPCLPSLHWHSWLGIRKSIRPAKKLSDGCCCGYLSEARCRLFAYGPADTTTISEPHHLLPHLNPIASENLVFKSISDWTGNYHSLLFTPFLFIIPVRVCCRCWSTWVARALSVCCTRQHHSTHRSTPHCPATLSTSCWTSCWTSTTMSCTVSADIPPTPGTTHTTLCPVQ